MLRATVFGEKLARALGSGPSKASLAAQETAVVQAAQKLVRPRFSWLGRPWSLPVAWALGAVALCLLVVGLWSTSTTTPVLVALGDGTRLQNGSLVKTARDEAHKLSFHDGSQVTVHAETETRVKRIAPEWTELGLYEGRLDLSISKRKQAHFAISAGPYRVHVIGTRFSVAFDRRQQRIQVAVSQGQVVVYGAGLPERGRAVKAGDRFEHHVGNVGSAREPAPAAPLSSTQAGSPQQIAPSEPDTRSVDGKRTNARASGKPVRPVTWQELARQGRYPEAMGLAEQAGFDTLLGELAASDLLMLANSARFTGNSARARQAFVSLRQRFPGKPASILASFYLARIALDMESNPRLAARWFRTYLSESPSGELAAGARVDLMNILHGLGDTAAARAVAEDYLELHPGGSHSKVARSLAGPASSAP